MFRPFSVVLLVFVGISGQAPIRADDFTIELKAVEKQNKTAVAKYPAPASKGQPRALLMAGVNTSITVKWTVANADKAATVKDALVHFFVVKIDKADQQTVPKLNKNVVAESALTMDFKAKDTATGEITFSVTKAGTYMMRLEIKGTAAKIEPFAALDLSVR